MYCSTIIYEIWNLLHVVSEWLYFLWEDHMRTNIRCSIVGSQVGSIFYVTLPYLWLWFIRLVMHGKSYIDRWRNCYHDSTLSIVWTRLGQRCYPMDRVFENHGHVMKIVCQLESHFQNKVGFLINSSINIAHVEKCKNFSSMSYH